MGTERSPRVPPRVRVGLGLLCIALGIAVSLSRLEAFAPDGHIESEAVRAAVLLWRGLAVALGVALLIGWRPSRPSPRVQRLALLAGALACSLLISEGLLRLALGPKPRWAPAPSYVGDHANRPSNNFLADPLLGWRMHPATDFRWTIEGQEQVYQANEEGFRSPYSRAEVLSAETRIALIGDSFTWGTGVEYSQTFGALLDSALGPALVYNQAQPGMGLDQMWMTLRHAALPLEPDLALVAFIDQDLDRSLTAFRGTEGMNKPTFVLAGGLLRPQSEHDRPAWPVRLLQRRSALWGLARVTDRAVGYGRPRGTWWSLNAAILDAMLAEARAAGVRLVIVRMPTKGGRSFPQLAAHLDTTDAAFVDLGESPPGELFFETDDHIDPSGHRFVAEALEPVVRGLLR